MERITGYVCDYCRKVLAGKWTMYKHEKACLKNPHRKNCIDCIHCVKKEGVKYRQCNVYNKKCSSTISANCLQYVDKRSK